MNKPLLALVLFLPVPGIVSAKDPPQEPPRSGEFRVNSRSSDPEYILPLGGEFRVNTNTAGVQRLSSIARHQAAVQPNFVITWESLNQDGSQYGVFAQRFVFRSPAGPEFRVNTYTTSDQLFADAATDSAGNFVVVWQSNNEDGDGAGIYAQRYTSAGVPAGSEFQVNTYTTGGQTVPDVAANFAGNFVVVWASTGQDGSGYGVFGQRYSATGAPLGPEFQVNTYTTGVQRFPAVAADVGANSFVVVWEGDSSDDQLLGIFGQRFSSAGVPIGGEFRVNTYTTGDQRYPAVAADNTGNFVVAWQSNAQDGSGYGVFAQRYAVGGSPLGSEFRVNNFTTNNQFFPAVAGGTRSMISWQSEGQDGSASGVFTQIFNSGVPELPFDYQVNSYTPGAQTRPGVIYGGFGFVVAWTSLQDPDGTLGVYCQRYNDFPVELQTFTVE